MIVKAKVKNNVGKWN